MSAAKPQRVCLRCRHQFACPDRFRFVCDLCHWIEEQRGQEPVS